MGTAFLLLIVASPLPLGSNRPLWWSLLALVTGLLLAIYAALVVLKKRRAGFSLRAPLVVLLPAAIALVWAAVQCVGGMPDGLAQPAWHLAAAALERPVAGAISLNPGESMTGVMRLLTYLGIFLLAMQLGRERAFADRMLRWLVGAGAVYALYGLIIHLFGIDFILWFKRWAYRGYLTSTFVNRNSYATYAALGLLCAATLLLSASRSLLKNGRTARQRILAAIETLSGPALWPLIICIVTGIALIQTGSRAGAFSALAGLSVLLLGSARARIVKLRQALIAIAGLAGMGVLFVLLTGSEIVDRLDSATLGTDRSSRADIYVLTETAIGDQPLTGTGLGTFPQVFSIYRPQTFDPFVLPDKAHNSYLSNLLELGIPAALLVFIALGAVAEITFAGLKRRRRAQIFPVLGLAAFATVALHSFVDFSLEIPAVAATYAALAGVCCAQSYRSSRNRHKKKQA